MLLKLTAKFSDDCKYSCPTASVNSASRANITEAPHTHKLSLPSPQWSLSLHLIPSDCQTHEQNTTLKNSHLGKHLPGKCPFFLNLTAAFHFCFSNCCSSLPLQGALQPLISNGTALFALGRYRLWRGEDGLHGYRNSTVTTM